MIFTCQLFLRLNNFYKYFFNVEHANSLSFLKHSRLKIIASTYFKITYVGSVIDLFQDGGKVV